MLERTFVSALVAHAILIPVKILLCVRTSWRGSVSSFNVFFCFFAFACSFKAQEH